MRVSKRRSHGGYGGQDEEEADMDTAMGALVRRAVLESWVKKLPQPTLERTLPGSLLRLSVGQRLQKDGSTVSKYVIGRVRP